MRGRQVRQRSSVGLQDREAVTRAQAHSLLIDRAAELVLLPGAGGVPPDHAAVGGDGEALEAALIFICHRGLVGPGDGFLAEEVGAAVDGVAQGSRKDAGFEAGKFDFETRSLGLHAARGRVVCCPHPADLFGFARQAKVGAGAAGDHQGGIPEGIPLFALDHFRRDGDVQFVDQRIDLLLGEAADAAGDFEFRREVLAEDDPGAGALARGQFADQGLPVPDGEGGAQALAALAVPGDIEDPGAIGGGKPGLRFVGAQVAILGPRGAGPQRGAGKNTVELHVCPPDFLIVVGGGAGFTPWLPETAVSKVAADGRVRSVSLVCAAPAGMPARMPAWPPERRLYATSGRLLAAGGGMPARMPARAAWKAALRPVWPTVCKPLAARRPYGGGCGSGRVVSALGFGDVAVIDLGLETGLFQALADFGGDHDRAVLAAGAAEGDGEITLALADVMRQQVSQ